MGTPPRRPASYEDLLAQREHVVGESVAGERYAWPRPAPRHSLVAGAIGEEVGPPFKPGRGDVYIDVDVILAGDSPARPLSSR